MSLNESIVEDAALEGFGELGYVIGHGPHLAPGESSAERDSFSEVVLVGRLMVFICDFCRRAEYMLWSGVTDRLEVGRTDRPRGRQN